MAWVVERRSPTSSRKALSNSAGIGFLNFWASTIWFIVCLSFEHRQEQRSGRDLCCASLFRKNCPEFYSLAADIFYICRKRPAFHGFSRILKPHCRSQV